jgi:predicted GNAT family acetyltransferase
MIKIDHQPGNNRFVLTKDEEDCILEYQLMADTENNTRENSKIDFSSTYVPFSLRGQGLAEQLVEVGLAWAKEQGYQIEASCWYVKKFL